MERAQYEANLAQRRYRQVDPDNRLVATVLEAEWNTKLRELEEARATEEQYRQLDQQAVRDDDRTLVGALPEQFAQFWNSPQTTARERKRLIRFVIEDVTVHKGEQIVAHVRFKGGATQTLHVPLPPPFAHSRFTAPETLAAIDRLLDDYTDAQIAEQLNQQGYHTFDMLCFQATHVYQLRRKHGLLDRYSRLRACSLLTAEELALDQGIAVQTVWRGYHQGRFVGVPYNDRGSCLFVAPTSCPSSSTASQ